MFHARTKLMLVALLAAGLVIVQAFASQYRPQTAASIGVRRRLSAASYPLFALRGGSDQEQPLEEGGDTNTFQDNNDDTKVEPPAIMESQQERQEEEEQQEQLQPATKTPSPIATLSTVFLSIGKAYGSALSTHPILTKSVTSGVSMGISDYLAQRIEQSTSVNNQQQQQLKMKLNRKRLLTSICIGLFYFGPAAHAWYDLMFRLFPGTSLVSTLQKAVMGQMLFGPSFTCIFFASSLWQSGQFTLRNWWQKIQRDLPGAWLAGVGFWPLVDVVSFSFVPVAYIPLFVNLWSLVWTIYLSMVSNRSSPPPARAE